jgi:polyisoprenoid-binding protein YceI
MKHFILTIMAALFCAPVFAAGYEVDYAKSRLAFSGKHTGNDFTGAFEKWDALIAFDPDDLAASKIEVTVDTASAKTGNKLYDGTLPNDDWFDVKNHPQAKFISSGIAKNPDGSYTAKGMLTIRAVAQPISFDFALSDLAAPTVKFTLTLDRLAFTIGAKSDPKAEWVSREIMLDVMLVAVRQ